MTVANNYVTAEQIAVHRWSPITELPAIFFAKVGAAVMLNRKRLCRFPFLLDNNTMAYSLSSTKWDADFAKALFGTVDLTSLVQVGALPSYNAGDVESMEIYLPSLLEQEQIGGFFKQLDTLITLHQRQPFLHSTPDISLSVRLIHPFYTSSWEQRKAKELFVSTADKGYPELPVLSATQDRGMIRRDENSINIFHDKKNEAGYKRVLPGQFVIHLRSFQGGFAHSAIEGITSPAYTVFGFSEPEKHDSEYWKYVFTSKSFIQRLETVTYGIRDGRSISYEEFLTLGFVYPSKAEQTAIARYLDKLSDLITLHQRKGKAAVSGCFLNCFSLEKSSAQSRTLELFGQISNQEIKYIIDGLSILGGKLRNFCVKLIILLGYTRINDIAKYHISRNTKCVHNINKRFD